MSHHWCFLKYISVEPPTAMFFFVDSQPAPWKKQLYCPAPWDPEKYAVYNQWIWCLILFSWSVLRRPAARWVEISSSLRKTLDVLNLGQALERVRTPVSFTRCFLVVFFFCKWNRLGWQVRYHKFQKKVAVFMMDMLPKVSWFHYKKQLKSSDDMTPWQCIESHGGCQNLVPVRN